MDFIFKKYFKIPVCQRIKVKIAFSMCKKPQFWIHQTIIDIHFELKTSYEHCDIYDILLLCTNYIIQYRTNIYGHAGFNVVCRCCLSVGTNNNLTLAMQFVLINEEITLLRYCG